MKDLAFLTAKTGDEFAILKGKKEDILFHGSKAGIDGKLSLDKSKKANDFGKGFYCGESLEQSAPPSVG